MFDRKQIREINAIDTNFRSDVIVAGIVDGGFDANQVVILRRENKVRETDKEVIDINYFQDYEGDGIDVLLVKANRQGIYDILPEGLFHNPASLREAEQEDIIESFRLQREKELNIRRFFSLYEAEIERTRVDVQLVEYRYDRPDKHRVFVDTMATLWPVIRKMDSLTAMLFLRTVPYIAEVRCSYTQAAQALSTITGYEVGIEEKIAMRVPKAKYTRMNAMQLGVNSVLKGRIPVRHAEVTVIPSADNVAEVLPGKRQYEVLTALLDTFLPNDIDYKVVIKAKDEDCTNRMGDKERPMILGVNAKLKNTSPKDESEE
jgi:hypothetical protein